LGVSSLFSFVWQMYAHSRKLMENDIWTVDFGSLLGASRLVCAVAGADSTVQIQVAGRDVNTDF